MSPPLKRYLELQIKTLQNVPRDADNLERLLKAKEREKADGKSDALDRQDTERMDQLVSSTNYSFLFPKIPHVDWSGYKQFFIAFARCLQKFLFN